MNEKSLILTNDDEFLKGLMQMRSGLNTVIRVLKDGLPHQPGEGGFKPVSKDELLNRLREHDGS